MHENNEKIKMWSKMKEIVTLHRSAVCTLTENNRRSKLEELENLTRFPHTQVIGKSTYYNNGPNLYVAKFVFL